MTTIRLEGRERTSTIWLPLGELAGLRPLKERVSSMRQGQSRSQEKARHFCWWAAAGPYEEAGASVGRRERERSGADSTLAAQVPNARRGTLISGLMFSLCFGLYYFSF